MCESQPVIVGLTSALQTNTYTKPLPAHAGSAKSTTSYLNSAQEVAVTSAAVDTTSAYVGHDAIAALHSLHTESRRQPFMSQSLPAQHIKMVSVLIPFPLHCSAYINRPGYLTALVVCVQL